MAKFNVISEKYVGEYPTETPEGEQFGIFFGVVEQLNGKLTNPDDYAEFSHGGFNTIEEARDYIQQYFNGNCHQRENAGNAEIWEEGKFEFLSLRDSISFIDESTIQGTETDSEIKELVEATNKTLRETGKPCQLATITLALLIALRNEKKAVLAKTA